jgi:hypothetical protein
MFDWMGPPKSIQRRDVRALDVNERDTGRRVRADPTGLSNRAQASCDRIFGSGNDRRRKAGNAGSEQEIDGLDHGGRRGLIIVEVTASVAIDLQIDESRRDPQIARFRAWLDQGDCSVLDNEPSTFNRSRVAADDLALVHSLSWLLSRQQRARIAIEIDGAA